MLGRFSSAGAGHLMMQTTTLMIPCHIIMAFVVLIETPGGRKICQIYVLLETSRQACKRLDMNIIFKAEVIICYMLYIPQLPGCPKQQFSGSLMRDITWANIFHNKSS